MNGPNSHSVGPHVVTSDNLVERQTEASCRFCASLSGGLRETTALSRETMSSIKYLAPASFPSPGGYVCLRAGLPSWTTSPTYHRPEETLIKCETNNIRAFYHAENKCCVHECHPPPSLGQKTSTATINTTNLMYHSTSRPK